MTRISSLLLERYQDILGWTFYGYKYSKNWAMLILICHPKKKSTFETDPIYPIAVSL